METLNVNQIFERVSNCIHTSNSLLQLETTERLVELFKHQYIQPELNEKINTIFVDKAEKLHYYEWKSFREFGSEAA
jgi:hypothetical protein